jgi:hypothetical protein
VRIKILDTTIILRIENVAAKENFCRFEDIACITGSIFISVSYIAITSCKRIQHAPLGAQASIVIFFTLFL